MKYLNYLPPEIQQSRWLKKLALISSVIVLVIVTIIALLFLQVDRVKKDIKEKQDRIALTTDLESDIAIEELKLLGNIQADTFVYNNPLAINRLLGVLLTRTPQDVVINTVFTETERQRRLSSQPQKIPTPSEEVIPSDPVEPKVPTEVLPEVPTEVPAEASTEPSTEPPTEPTTQVAENQTIIPQPGILNRENTYEEPQTIIIRGTAFDLQSISLLAGALKNEPYVQSVELSPIENYNDGYFNHKLFELTLILVGGG